LRGHLDDHVLSAVVAANCGVDQILGRHAPEIALARAVFGAHGHLALRVAFGDFP
jgi:hypothetical protein